MTRTWRSDLGRAGIFALATVVVAGGVPLLARPSANFLGTDVTSLAAGVIGFYPWIAVAEAARVLGAALVIAFLVAWYAGAMVRTSGLKGVKAQWLLFPLTPWLAFASWGLGAALRYPALFEGALPEGLTAGLFRLAFLTSPTFWFCVAWVLMVIPGLVRLRPRRGGGHVTIRRSTQAAAALSVLVSVICVGRTSRATEVKRTGRPNVLLIGVDSLRADRVGRPAVTPILTALAADSRTVSFKNHWIGVPRTFPSWVEMLSGRSAPKTGIRHMFPGFAARSSESAGLGTMLRDTGYETAAFSDFAGDIFPRFEAGFAEVHAPKLDLRTMIRLSIDQLFPAFLPFMTTGPTRRWFPALQESPAYADPANLAGEVVSWLGARGGAPWFATVFFSTAHFPYAAPFPYFTKFADPQYEGVYRFQKNPDLTGAAGRLSNKDVTQVRALYDGAIGAVDQQIGVLLSELDRLGLAENTVVVVTADHGEDLLERGVGQGHGEHLRGKNVLRVPLLLRLPEAPAQRRVRFTTRSIDLASTIAGALGLGRVGDGVDLTPWTRAKAPAAPDLSAYAETGIWFSRVGEGFFQKRRLDYPGIAGLLAFDQGFDGEIVLDSRYDSMITTAKHRMLLHRGRKLIYMPTPRGIVWELYDQKRDPNNRKNLSATVDPATLKALQEELLTVVAGLEAPRGKLLDGFVVPR